ncbi:MAG: respiratory nitrate reductase subunit gamma [Gammaproteobacteria bacterium]|nr:respiratory nitrate reductase subunit gamma [Gammaproteobacteria bacterium]MDH5729553.1 respiratory nitrate reductase subunit gamma [Gammaproteobacteria bacterium]
MLSIVLAVMFYAATLVLLLGIAYRVSVYARTPAPLKIPTMPAPTTSGGVAMRLLREVTIFESLFKSNKWIWIFAILFHFGMLLVLLRHIRYFNEPVWVWVQLIQPFGTYAGFAMLIGLLGLWVRRVFVERIRYISGPSDHLMLALLSLIAGTGLIMKFVVHTDIVALKTFTLGLLRFDIQPLPADPVLVTHLLAVILLMLVFPVSKLLHAPGVFFSPSRNQVDNSREKRHVTAWANNNAGQE